MISILIVLAGLTCAQLNSMHHNALTHRASTNLASSAHQQTEGYVRKHTSTNEPQPSACAIHLHPKLTAAVTRNDVKTVKVYFEHWSRWLNSWSNHNTEMTECLKLAATQPKEKTDKVVAYLLDMFTLPTENTDATCLLNAAAKHGHLNIISLINELRPNLGIMALFTAIQNNNAHAVSNLLKGGIDPNLEPTTLDKAVKAFKKDDSKETIAHRLYIVRTLLNHLPSNNTLSLNTTDLGTMSEETRGKVSTLFTTHTAPTKAPTKVIMHDDQAACQPATKSELSCAKVLFSTCVLCPLGTLVGMELFCRQPRQ